MTLVGDGHIVLYGGTSKLTYVSACRSGGCCDASVSGCTGVERDIA